MKMPKEVIHMVRTCPEDGVSRNGFKWPDEGYVECPDWDPDPVCGGGLHGCLYGEGESNLLNWNQGAIWRLVAVEPDEVVYLGGKVKVPRAWVIYSGTREKITSRMAELYPDKVVIGVTLSAGDSRSATAGDRGSAAAGYRGTAVAGNHGTATAGYRGVATAGNHGVATAGYRGSATAGKGGIVVAGKGGTAKAGKGGIVVAGDHGVAKAGKGGCLIIKRYDGSRYRAHVAYVGEGGIKADVAYQLDKDGNFVEA